MSRGYSLVSHDNFINYDQVCQGNHHVISQNIKNKLDNGKKLTDHESILVEGLKQINADAALGLVERSLGIFDEKQDAAEEEVLSTGENRKKGKKRQGSVLKRYAVESNSAFQRTKLEAAISLHAEIGRMKATEHKFKDQALAIFQAPGVKSNNGFTHEHILDAEKVYVVKQNPKCQIYFCKDLHAHFHGTVYRRTTNGRKTARPEQVCPGDRTNGFDCNG